MDARYGAWGYGAGPWQAATQGAIAKAATHKEDPQQLFDEMPPRQATH